MISQSFKMKFADNFTDVIFVFI